jgi:hypothetical protein
MTQPLPRSYQEILWGDDMDPGGRETDSDLASLEQDILHILSETLGSNLDDPNRGIGAVGYLSGTSQALEAMPALMDAQLLDEPRITSCRTSIVQQSDGSFLIQPEILVAGQVVNLNYKLGPDGLTVA